MEPLDRAYGIFAELTADIAEFHHSVVTEADVRAKVVDPIFANVLGWSPGDLYAEDSTLDGYVDYVFSVSGRSRLIVEAKRDSRSLGCLGKDTGRGYILDGPAFRAPAAREGIRQAIRYCGLKNAELACVTNGNEWIVFRGNRIGDGTDTSKGMAIVFGSRDGIAEKFDLFYRLLSKDSVERHEFRAFFQEIEGQPIRASRFKRSLRETGSARLLEVSTLAADVDRVMSSFFDRLTGDEDPDLLIECFVESNESRSADNRLARISEDIITRIRSIDTADSEQLTQLIERATQTKRHEFVVIVGTKGAGKSTFITRFFSKVLRRSLATQCVSCRINLGDSTGDTSSVVTWLDEHLLTALEGELFGEEPPEFEEIEGMFFDEYRRTRRFHRN